MPSDITTFVAAFAIMAGLLLAYVAWLAYHERDLRRRMREATEGGTATAGVPRTITDGSRGNAP